MGVGHSHHHAQNGHLSNYISLVDGYVYDIDAAAYCRSSDPHELILQRSKTYMKDYAQLIKAAGSYTAKSWEEAYMSFSGGEGRDACMPRDPKVRPQPLTLAISHIPPPHLTMTLAI